MHKAVVATLLAALLLPGCLPVSLHPLAAPEDVYFDPQLVGRWQDGNGSGTWEFSILEYNQAGENEEPKPYSYLVRYSEKEGPTATLYGTLTRIGESTFLDLTRYAPYMTAGVPERNLLEDIVSLPVHLWMRLESKDGVLHLAPMDPDWLDAFLKSNPQGLKYEDGTPLITASTPDLRAFVAAHMHEENFFGGDGIYTFKGAAERKSGQGVTQGNSDYSEQFQFLQPTTGTKEASP